MADDDQADTGPQLDPDARERLEAIQAEGDQAEEAERAEELERHARQEYPYDRELAGALAILDHGVFSGLLASRRGPHWRLSAQEAHDLAKAQAQCIERYIGSVVLGPAVTLVFTSAAIVGPRLKHDAELVQQQRRAQAAGEGDGAAE